MDPHRSSPHPARRPVGLGLFIGLMLAIGAFGALQASDRPGAPGAVAADHATHDVRREMSETEMQKWVDDWFDEHPVVGRSNVAGAPVVTFRAINGLFDADGDFNGTRVDTVTIMAGETVAWQRLIGTHTVTNGTGSGDPAAGTLFDVPLDAVTPTFSYTFDDVGTFPFFCRPHEADGMRGVIIVVDPTPTHKTTWGELKARLRAGSPGSR